MNLCERRLESRCQLRRAHSDAYVSEPARLEVACIIRARPEMQASRGYGAFLATSAASSLVAFNLSSRSRTAPARVSRVIQAAFPPAIGGIRAALETG